MEYPKIIKDLSKCFSKYPGIGAKTAERLAFFTFSSLSESDVNDFCDSLKLTKTDITTCTVCGNLSENDICDICTDDSRDESTILVIESIKNLYAFESSESYKGRYHVLGGVIDPLNGVGPDDINLRSLIERLRDDKITELILATNPSVEGESTALYISKLLEGTGINITRLAHGIPLGGDIEYTDSLTLKHALNSRNKY